LVSPGYGSAHSCASYHEKWFICAGLAESGAAFGFCAAGVSAPQSASSAPRPLSAPAQENYGPRFAPAGRPAERLANAVRAANAAGCTAARSYGAALLSGTMRMPASMLTGAAAWGIVWFLLGFLVYALLFATTGSLVSRQEDAGSVVGAVLILIIVPYVLGISILPADPENGLLRILSLIPFFSPTLMPMRTALGVPGWELGTALALTVLLAVAMIGLAGRVYSNAVLRMGSRIRLSDAWRAA
jgi:hypothetical protein